MLATGDAAPAGSERQRVWRACETCRRKKIKCNGVDPCLSCTNAKLHCVFANSNADGRRIEPRYVQELEKRLASMEENATPSSIRQLEERLVSMERTMSQFVAGYQRHNPPAGTDVDASLNERFNLDIQDSASTNSSSGQDQPPMEEGFQEIRSNSEEPAGQPIERPNSLEEGCDNAPMAAGFSAPCPPELDLSSTKTSASSLQSYIDGKLGCYAESPDSQHGHPGRAESVPSQDAPTPQTLMDVCTLPSSLVTALCHEFFSKIYPMFPIISDNVFQKRFSALSKSAHPNEASFSLVLYALSAVAAPLLSSDHPALSECGWKGRSLTHLGATLHKRAAREMGRMSEHREVDAVQSDQDCFDMATAQGLLSLYLIRNGRANNAWIAVGHAVRLAQSIGLQKSLHANGTASGEEGSFLWWCLHILDVSLSTALLRPLTVDDADCDLDLPSETVDASKPSWFSTTVCFHIMLGRIYRKTRTLKHEKRLLLQGSNANNTLRKELEPLYSELNAYFRKNFPPEADISQPPSSLEGKFIALISYHTAVILLYRPFMSRPGRFLDATGAEALLRCADASKSCINMTPLAIASILNSQYLIQAGRVLFVSIEILLHCIQVTQNLAFIHQAWLDVGTGLKMLQEIKYYWPGAEKYESLVQNMMEETQKSTHGLEKETSRYKLQRTRGISAAFPPATTSILQTQTRISRQSPTSLLGQETILQERSFDPFWDETRGEPSEVPTSHLQEFQPRAKKRRTDEALYNSSLDLGRPAALLGYSNDFTSSFPAFNRSPAIQTEDMEFFLFRSDS